MNMYLHELKAMRKSAAIWVCSMISLAAVYFAVYPGIVKEADEFKKLIANYPAPALAALGISLDSITSLLGYYSIIITFIALCGAIQAMNMGVSILSKEMRERTADFLLVKPVSRASIVSAKLLSSVTMLFITDLLYYAAVSILASAVSESDYSGKLFFMINATLFFIQLIFLAIGIFVSVLFKKLKSVLPISLGVVFGFFFIGAFISGSGTDSMRFLSPFQYFSPSYIIQNAGFETPYLLAGAAIILAATAAGYIIYIKKDIHAVN